MIFIESIPIIVENNDTLRVQEILFLYSKYIKSPKLEELINKGGINFPLLLELGYIISISPLLINECNIKRLFSPYEIKKDKLTPTVGNINNISDWIEEYRNIFKQCKHTTPKGNPRVVMLRMKWFFTTYPQYADKDLILKATKYGIAQIKTKYGESYIPRADNFIVVDDYRTPMGGCATNKVYVPGKEYLSLYCEELTNNNTTQDSVRESNIQF